MTRRKKAQGQAYTLVGLKLGSLLATSTHSPLGKACVQYATAAKHSGSMEAREKAGPQICSSRTMIEKGGAGQRSLDREQSL